MFPIRDDNPHFLTPYVTYGIIGLNVIAWVLVQGLGSEPTLSGSVCSLGLVPGELLQTVPAGNTVSKSGRTVSVCWAIPRHGIPQLRRCFCMAVGFTLSATCGFSGSSATMSKTPWGTGASQSSIYSVACRQRPCKSRQTRIQRYPWSVPPAR